MSFDGIIIKELRTHGFSPLTAVNWIGDTNAFLHLWPVYLDAHVPQTARNMDQTDRTFARSHAALSECICVPTAAAILAPHVIEFGMELTEVASEYLDRNPAAVAYSMNAFWTRPGPKGTRPDIQEFHRDQDDDRFLTMFIYLTDVMTIEDGPHEMQGPDGVSRYIYGPAGTAFLADTSNLHRGLKPTTKERGIIWYRWGVSDRPAANVWDNIEPVPYSSFGGRLFRCSPYMRQSIKLLVTPS